MTVKRAKIIWSRSWPGWHVRFRDGGDLVEYSSELGKLGFNAGREKLEKAALKDIENAGYEAGPVVEFLVEVDCN